MKIAIYSWVVLLISIIIMDFIWLSLTAVPFYKKYLSHVFSGDFSYSIALIFYLLYSFGIVQIIILPGLEYKLTFFQIFYKAFILGLISYGAYDLTNQATIKNWPTIVTIVDMSWGAIVTSSAACITYLILKNLIKQN